ncbi:chromosome partitioning protein [Sinosporangium album]|uniref:Chromosome partitioning protein n=1 Tax=Sinosporangium album TaxID=504805 RepID=A0A1G8EG58_9ACTN|nr:ParA family protein [Sinosporangium album]SDH68760.1 chromosome partitioning protein [Sinosporangium album]
MSAVVMSFASLKGGVGKTTTTANFGATAADTHKLRVAMFDADPQGQLSDWFGVKRRPGLGFAELINPPKSGAPTVHDTLVQPDTDVPLYIVPTSYAEMEDVEGRLTTDLELGGITAIRRVLQPILDDFDVILLDTRPSLGNLTSAAMCASNVLVPVTSPNVTSFQSTMTAVEKAERIRQLQNPNLVIPGWLMNMWEDGEEASTVVQMMAKREIAAFQPAIYRGKYISKGYLFGNPSVWQFPNHSGSHQDYKPLTQAVLSSIGLVAA